MTNVFSVLLGMDRGDKNYEIYKSEKRERKRKRHLQALANIKQVEQR